MGNIVTVTRETFPKQGPFLGKRMRVGFHYHTDDCIGALCVRDDAEAPWRTIFQLDDGRFVMATECQYREE